MSMDVFDTGPNTASFLVTEFFNNGSFFASSPNIVNFTILSPGVPAISSVTLGAASANFNDPSRISFSATDLGYDLGGLPNGVDFFRLDVTFVPEPSSALLAGLGLGILSFLRPARSAGC